VGAAVSRKLLLRHGGTPIALTYERKGGHLALDLGGRRFEADVSHEGFWFDVRSGGRATRCAVVRGRRGLWVSCEGRSFFLEEERAETAAKGAPSADELRAPMTGRVVQVAAVAGASVSEGDLLVSIEAMKMEFRLVAPENGVIADVRCEAGSRVELGDLLVVLEPRA
jgi:acetyl/propionyl-CoA carboxylase alpha subunit